MLVFALSLSSEIEKYGAYAGFAAIPGLALLALLYFAQAREVRRLREWAGRAPERAQELQERVSTQAATRPAPAAAPAAAPERRVVAQPMGAGTPAAQRAAAATQAPAKPGAPGQAPAPGSPAVPGQGAPGKAPAVPGHAPATGSPATPGQAPAPGTPSPTPSPAAKPAAPGQSPAAPGQAPPGGAPGRPQPVPAAARAGTAAPVKPGEGAAKTGEADGAAPAAPTPAPATAAAGAPPRPAPQRTEVRRPAAAPLRRPPASATAPPRAPSERRREPSEGARRRPLAIGIAVLAGLLLIIVLATQVLGGDDKPASQPNTVAAPAPAPAPAGRQPAVQRGDVTVSVLNGTTVPGLAAQVGDQLESAGFARGQVTNAADQQRSETTVQYAPDFRAAANEAAGILKIPRTRVKPLDANTQAIAGPDAEVVVTVGADRTQ